MPENTGNKQDSGKIPRQKETVNIDRPQGAKANTP